MLADADVLTLTWSRSFAVSLTGSLYKILNCDTRYKLNFASVNYSLIAQWERCLVLVADYTSYSRGWKPTWWCNSPHTLSGAKNRGEIKQEELMK